MTRKLSLIGTCLAFAHVGGFAASRSPIDVLPSISARDVPSGSGAAAARSSRYHRDGERQKNVLVTKLVAELGITGRYGTTRNGRHWPISQNKPTHPPGRSRTNLH